MAGTPEIILAQQDFSFIPPLGLVVPVVAGDVVPSSLNVGLKYRNSATGRLRYVRDDTTIVDIDLAGRISNADLAADAAIALSKIDADFDALIRGVRLDEFAAPTAPVDVNDQRLTNLAVGVDPDDAVPLHQVTALVEAANSGMDYKDSVRVASATNVDLAAPGDVDGVTLAADDRVLLYGQTVGADNGIYVFDGVALTRSTDTDEAGEMTAGMTVPVVEGTRANTLAIMGSAGSFVFLSVPTTYVAGSGIDVTGNVISLLNVTIGRGGTGATTAPDARQNLNVPQRGHAEDLGTLAVATPVTVTHGLGTTDVNIQVYRVSDGATVRIGSSRVDANTVQVQSDVAVGSGVLRVVVTPVI